MCTFTYIEECVLSPWYQILCGTQTMRKHPHFQGHENLMENTGWKAVSTAERWKAMIPSTVLWATEKANRNFPEHSAVRERGTDTRIGEMKIKGWEWGKCHHFGDLSTISLIFPFSKGGPWYPFSWKCIELIDFFQANRIRIKICEVKSEIRL